MTSQVPFAEIDIGRRPVRLPFAVGLAVLAGWVDAVAFVHWGGVFVSFMSGNSTVFSTGMAQGAWSAALPVGAVVLSFVAGVMAGEWVYCLGRRFGHALVLVAEAAFLFAAAAASLLPDPGWLPSMTLAAGLGIQNATIYQLGRVNIALTYVTGTLVQIGRGAARAVIGEGSWRAPLPYLLLWCGLVGGAAAGAVAARHHAVAALLAAGLAALLFAAATAGAIAQGKLPRRD